ncbi:MAG TPA: TIGR02757 family protein [Bacteroidales bacterium]|nr:TIGR02757 family protein [Bacteroidales bacterium]
MSLKQSYNGIAAGEMKLFLEEKYLKYNNTSFIASDPVSIPHGFTDRHDIEISGFLTAVIAWGRRELILSSSQRMFELMEYTPYEFIMSASENELYRLSGFVHRTFNGTDCIYFLRGLRHIYLHYNSMEEVILQGMEAGGSIREGLSHMRSLFFSLPHAIRNEKHFADVMKGAAGKRLNMFLRWMVRKDNHGVDFGIWDKIDPAMLYIPLDLHSGNTARRLGLLKRKMNDWKAVEELTDVLRLFDPKDPVKYDFALFGLGVNEKF